MTQETSVYFEGFLWNFPAGVYREYKAAIAAAEEEIIKRFGKKPHFCSPDAVAAWEHEVISAAHKRLFGDNRPEYKGARLPADTTDAWASIEAFRRGSHCKWTDCPGNAGMEDTNYL